ncbi:unnamed protein product [Blepharisma stoltei]|uniref:Uncharacterized protein n=1 Tax=Blepharisma stoltei TaxID=1481888 RepID=A0AAU9J968_9CILI|nr:unnamed protein product [Blepharisma stoltei]
MSDLDNSTTTDISETDNNDGDLGEKAAVLVSGIVLFISTMLVMYQLWKYYKHLIYKPAQIALMILFLMPIFIGWTALAVISTMEKQKTLEFCLNVYKSIGLIAFMFYIDRMMGWVKNGDESTYSRKERQECLMRVGSAKCIYGCIKPSPLTTPKEADSYMNKTYAGVLQLSIVLLLIGIGDLIVYFWFHDVWVYKGPAHYSLAYLALIAKVVSSCFALNYLFNFSHFAHHIPELERLGITTKFYIIKLTMMFTEIQPILILFLAELGAISNDSKYNAEEITTYTNSLLLCSEMIVVGFLQLLVFPVEDFVHHPETRKPLKEV